PPRPPCRPQRRLAALVPAAIPDAGRLPRHPEGAGHLGLGGAAGKHPGGFQAPLLQTAEVAAPGPRLDRHRSPRVRRPCLHTQHAGPNYVYQPIQRSSLTPTNYLQILAWSIGNPIRATRDGCDEGRIGSVLERPASPQQPQVPRPAPPDANQSIPPPTQLAEPLQPVAGRRVPRPHVVARAPAGWRRSWLRAPIARQGTQLG